MRAGRLSQPITFLSKSVTRDALGGEIITWVEEGDDWADVSPIVGREYFAAQQVEAETDIRFRVRYRADVTTVWRIEWRDALYDIVDVLNIDARDRTLELMCKTAPNA